MKSTLYTEITGAKVSEFYTGDRTIYIDLRLAAADRNNLAALKNLPIYPGEAGYVPLEQIAKISYDAEFGLINRRNLKPTITVQADILSGTASDAAQKAFDATEDLRQNLPLGYSIEPGGNLEQGDKSTNHLLTMLPLVFFVIMTLLTAPLGIIGVIFALIILSKPPGFVAQLGVIALSGMIIRNSVILIDQIQQHEAAGENLHDAIIVTVKNFFAGLCNEPDFETCKGQKTERSLIKRATREENIKKINAELEKMSDEQLEQVAGGNIGQTSDDSTLLYAYGLLDDWHGTTHMMFHWKSDSAEVDAGWRKAGITCVTKASGKKKKRI